MPRHQKNGRRDTPNILIISKKQKLFNFMDKNRKFVDLMAIYTLYAR